MAGRKVLVLEMGVRHLPPEPTESSNLKGVARVDVKRLRLVAGTDRVDVPTESTGRASLLGEVDDPVSRTVGCFDLDAEGSFPDDAA
jgi:hypothetical protein